MSGKLEAEANQKWGQNSWEDLSKYISYLWNMSRLLETLYVAVWTLQQLMFTLPSCGRSTWRKPMQIEQKRKSNVFTFTGEWNVTDLTQQFGQTQHLSCEHPQADEDGVQLADGASYVPRRNLPQVHGKHAESYTYQGEKGFKWRMMWITERDLRTVYHCEITDGQLCLKSGGGRYFVLCTEKTERLPAAHR